MKLEWNQRGIQGTFVKDKEIRRFKKSFLDLVVNGTLMFTFHRYQGAMRVKDHRDGKSLPWRLFVRENKNWLDVSEIETMLYDVFLIL